MVILARSDLRRWLGIHFTLLIVVFFPVIAVAQTPTPPMPPPVPQAAVVLPVDTRLRQRLEAAKDYLRAESWGEAIAALQVLLDAREDQFLPPVKTVQDGKIVVHAASVRSEADRLLAAIPPMGRDFYNAQFGPKARAILAESLTREDPHLLAPVLQRFQHTDVGGEAVERFAAYQLDRGQPALAAALYDRLPQRRKNPDPLTILKVILANRLAGHVGSEENAWKSLRLHAPEGLSLSGRAWTLDQLRAEVDRLPRHRDTAREWTTFRGTPGRSALAECDLPLLEPLWHRATASSTMPAGWIDNGLRYLERHDQPALTGFHPLITSDKVYYRSHGGIHAVQRTTGAELWHRSLPLALESAVRDSGKVVQLRNWLQSYGEAPALPLRNALTGTLSSDGLRLYAIEDLPFPPPPELVMNVDGNSARPFGPMTDAVHANRLRAFDGDTGDLLWERGGRGKGDLHNGFFLGPPLPFDGRLHALLEREGELRLIVLDPKDGSLLWSQRLAMLRERVLHDPGRRLRGCHLTYAGGLLICPTDAGAVVAVDPATRTLVWAFLYPSRKPAPSEGQVAFTPTDLENGWGHSAPLVEGDTVLAAPADTDMLYALSLTDGTPRWQADRAGDLLLGGVFRDKVLVVGSGHVRALQLADGKPAWRTETGQPSGLGVAGDGVYYLPVRISRETGGPGVLALSVDNGQTKAFAPSRTGEVIGNLAYSRGEVVSQTAKTIAVYPHLRSRLERAEQILAQKPRDPRALTERATFRRDQGNFAGALADLRTALSVASPAMQVETQRHLHDVLRQSVARDFTSGMKHLDELRASCQPPTPADGDLDQRRLLAEEQRRRQANVLLLEARGRADRRESVAALALLGRLSEEASHVPGRWEGEAVGWTAFDAPRLSYRPAVHSERWIRGRVHTLLETAKPAEHLQIEAEVRRQWKTIQTRNDVEALGRFAALFGSVPEIGSTTRLAYAERLVDSDRGRHLEAEQLLLDLRRGATDPTTSAWATYGLASLLTRAGRVNEALPYYRLLGTEYSSISLDGTRGANLLAGLAMDRRFAPLLDDPWSRKKFQAQVIATSAPLRGQVVGLDPFGDVSAYFQRHRLVLDLGSSEIKLLDRETREELMAVSVPLGPARSLLVKNLQPHARIPFAVEGHLAVVALGHVVVGLDLLERRLLWRRELDHRPTQAPGQIDISEQGAIRVVYPSGHAVRFGSSSPIRPQAVCVGHGNTLVALDPLLGTLLWTTPLPVLMPDLFADDRCVYVASVASNGLVESIPRVLRLEDGTSVRETPWKEWTGPATVRGVDHSLYVAFDRPGASPGFQLVGARRNGASWTVPMPAGSLPLQTQVPHLGGFLTKDRKVHVHDLRARRLLFTAEVEAEHLGPAIEAHLLADRELIYLLLNREFKPTDPAAAPPTVNLLDGLRCLPAHGVLYAFQHNGSMKWHNDSLSCQRLVLERYAESPVLLFTASVLRRGDGNGVPMPVVASIEKRTGKSIILRHELPVGTPPFHAVRLNPATGTVDLVGRSLMIRHQAQ